MAVLCVGGWKVSSVAPPFTPSPGDSGKREGSVRLLLFMLLLLLPPPPPPPPRVGEDDPFPLNAEMFVMATRKPAAPAPPSTPNPAPNRGREGGMGVALTRMALPPAV